MLGVAIKDSIDSACTAPGRRFRMNVAGLPGDQQLDALQYRSDAAIPANLDDT